MKPIKSAKNEDTFILGRNCLAQKWKSEVNYSGFCSL